MRSSALAAVAAAALADSSAFALPIRHPAPEPYYGHRGSTCATPNTHSVGAMGEATAFSSPVDPASEQLINSLVARVGSSASTATLIERSAMPELTRKSCFAAIAKLKTSANCASGPLYGLSDGEIRQEWLCKGKVAYMLYYTVEQGRITNIWAIDNVPPIYAVPVH